MFVIQPILSLVQLKSQIHIGQKGKSTKSGNLYGGELDENPEEQSDQFSKIKHV
jgi:hypothetical protein